MKIDVYGTVQEGTELSITINNETKHLDSSNKHIYFDIAQEQSYEILIEQEKEKNNITAKHIIFFIFTAVIQGIFNILFMNSKANWYKAIQPYVLKAKVVINLQKDTALYISYRNTKYYKHGNQWMVPIYTIESNGAIQSIEKIFTENPYSFQNQYFNYAKRLLSISLVTVIIFMCIFISALITAHSIVAITMGIFVALIACLDIVLLVSQYKKYKKLFKTFNE